MAKGIILGKPGDGDLPEPGSVTQSDIDRAAAAVRDAPTTASGIVIPPHVAEEEAAPRHTGPNRADRRAWERSRRRRGRPSKQPRHKQTAGEKRAQAQVQATHELGLLDRAYDLLVSAKAEEQAGIEKLLRDAGGIDLG